MGKLVLCDMSMEVLDGLLDGKTQEERLAAMEKIPTLADKDVVADYLIERPMKEEDAVKRMWSVSALAAINKAGTTTEVADHMNPEKEVEGWVRYWACIALAKMQPQDLKTRLTQALDDDEVQVRAVALRLLIENDLDGEAPDKLVEMLRSQSDKDRWAACKVLRRTAGHQPLPRNVEKKFVPLLVDRLLNTKEWMDIRYQAAMALGDVKHYWRDSIKALMQALKEQIPNDWVRRVCVEGLARIKQPEVKDGLLYALRDRDAEIRTRAANSLKDVLGAPDAVSLIAEHLLEQDEPQREYINALREIDRRAASTTLTSYSMHPDTKMSERASKALTMLGGEEAVRALLAQQTKALDTYTKMLGDVEKNVLPFLNSIMQRVSVAFRMSMFMHGTIFVIGILMLIVSGYMALLSGFDSFQGYVGVGGAAGSLGVLLTIFYKNPLGNIQNSLTGLVKVNVVFLGYIRQMNQIDATFKQLFLTSDKFGLQQLKDTVQYIQDSVNQTLEQVKTHLSV